MRIDDFLVAYNRFEELGYVNPSTGKPYSRQQIKRMMKRNKHPLSLQVSDNRQAWWNSELRERYTKFPIARSLTGERTAQCNAPGRPRGSKVVIIDGRRRCVLPEAADAED